MHINSVVVANYQCFDNTGLIGLDPGFNLVVGRNNAGKSALLRALSLGAPGDPHRSLKSVPRPGVHTNQVSVITVELSASGDDFRDAVFSDNRNWLIPLPTEFQASQQAVDRLWPQLIAASKQMTFSCKVTAGLANLPGWVPDEFPTMRAYSCKTNPKPEVFTIAPNLETGTARYAGGPQQISSDGDSGVQLARQIATGIYKFEAERLHLSRHKVGPTTVLTPTASNLAEVLDNLTGNPRAFTVYEDLVREVFPSITAVSLKNLDKGELEIMIWQTPPELEREDLAVPLGSCGTGVGQVLAILYVVKTSRSPCTLLIDEPNSFLHPGAARALIRILKRFPQHQYVIATHSPEVLGEVGAARVLQVRFEDGRTLIDQFDTLSIDTAAGILGDLGARLSDVLGYETVIWVEGPSDADVLTLIGRNVADTAAGWVFLPVRSTSTFETVDLREVLYLHRRLSQQKAPVPPVVRFVFDREGRTEQELKELRHESGDTMEFLPRKMLENYFLDAEAVASLITHLDTEAQGTVGPEAVMKWIDGHGFNSAYEAPDFRTASGEWLRHVHGGDLLAELISDLTDARQEYRKTTHAPWLAEWLLKNRPEQLTDLVNIVKDVLQPQPGRALAR